MGNSASSSGRGHHDDTVDYGYLTPQGVYTGQRDWNQAIVTQLICDRKLAPFYRPLEDYDESWDDDQILAARKDLPDADGTHSEAGSTRTHDSSSLNGLKAGHHKRPSLKDPQRCPDASIYRGAVECPICFLYYPPNINHSRCCDQAICTECFVQIKRTEPTTTHLVSEPAACPYCVQDNFGVVYTPPLWRAGFGSDGTPPSWPDSPSPKGSQQYIDSPPPFPTHKRRQKSFGHNSPEVVTTDQIRPDWEAKLAAVRAAVTRRANRRIIMRQVGDRLIPVGVTSGRVHALPTEDGQAQGEGADSTGSSGSRRSRRRQQQGQPDFNQFLGSVGLGGQDLEELMVMEAMRLSLLEHEEQQKREAQSKEKNETETESGQIAGSTSAASALSPADAPTPATSTTSPQGSDTTTEPERRPNHVDEAVTPLGSRTSTPRSQTPIPHPIEAPTISTLLENGSAVPDTSSTTVHSPDSPASGSRPFAPVHTDSFADSIVSEDSPSSYDILPSSSESSLVHEPLIEQEVARRTSTESA